MTAGGRERRVGVDRAGARGGGRVICLPARRRRDLPPVVRHHPRRGRPGRARPPALERAVVRMIHACGMVDLVDDVGRVGRLRRAPPRAALQAGAPVLCDTAMVAAGVTRARLPAANDVVCTLGEPADRRARAALGTTRSAAALEHWRDRLAGAVVVVGNAPTALFRLLELVADGAGAAGGRDRRAGGVRRRRRVEGRAGRRPTSSTSSSTAGAAAARSPRPRSTPSPASGSEAVSRGGCYGVGVGPGDPELMTRQGRGGSSARST